MRAPFPWPGGKAMAADLVWPRLGDPTMYIEPFAGGLGCLLMRPNPEPRAEIVNDACGWLVNFWRCVKYCRDVEAFAASCKKPPMELELAASRREFERISEGLPEFLQANIRAYDEELARLWWWGVSTSMRVTNGIFTTDQESIPGRYGYGCHRDSALRLIEACQHRLRHVAVMYGDWSRAVTPGRLKARGVHHHRPAVLLDPPYGESVYYSSQTAEGVHEWCVEHADSVRIALFGLENQHHLPGWDAVPWTRPRGGRRKELLREMIWFSPSCLPPDQPTLF